MNLFTETSNSWCVGSHGPVPLSREQEQRATVIQASVPPILTRKYFIIITIKIKDQQHMVNK